MIGLLLFKIDFPFEAKLLFNLYEGDLMILELEI
jgi:hypothetical protein